MRALGLRAVASVASVASWLRNKKYPRGVYFGEVFFIRMECHSLIISMPRHADSSYITRPPQSPPARHTPSRCLPLLDISRERLEQPISVAAGSSFPRRLRLIRYASQGTGQLRCTPGHEGGDRVPIGFGGRATGGWCGWCGCCTLCHAACGGGFFFWPFANRMCAVRGGFVDWTGPLTSSAVLVLNVGCYQKRTPETSLFLSFRSHPIRFARSLAR